MHIAIDLKTIVQLSLDEPSLYNLLGQRDCELVGFAKNESFAYFSGPILENKTIN